MNEYSVELGGITLHGGRHWEYDEWILQPGVSGIGPMSYRSSTIDMPGRRGVVPVGVDLLASRQLSFETMLIGSNPESAERMAHDLAFVWRPQPDVVLRARFAGGVRKMIGRTRACELSFEELHLGVVKARCVFEGVDGVWLSETGRHVTIGVSGRAVGSLAAPLIEPLSSSIDDPGEELDTTAAVRNAGTAPAGWTASISGPVADVELVLDGRAVRTVGTVETGSVMVVDSSTHTVTVDGLPQPGWVSVLSDWWSIDPGVHELELRAVSGVGAATVSWSDTWL